MKHYSWTTHFFVITSILALGLGCGVMAEVTDVASTVNEIRQKSRPSVGRQQQQRQQPRKPPQICAAFAGLVPLNRTTARPSQLWSVNATVDQTCAARGRVDLRRNSVASAHGPGTSSLRVSLAWLMATAKQLEPKLRYKLVSVDAAIAAGKLTVSGKVSIEGADAPVPAAVRKSFLKALETFTRIDAPPEGKTLCVDARGLADRFKVGNKLLDRPVKILVPADISATLARAIAAGRQTIIMTVDRTNGVLLGKTRIRSPSTLVLGQMPKCGCDLMLAFKRQPRGGQSVSFKVDGILADKAQPRAALHLRITKPGTPEQLIAQVRPLERSSAIPSTPAELLRVAYFPKSLVVSRTGSTSVTASAGEWFLDLALIRRFKAQHQRAAKKMANSEVVERLCFLGPDTKSLVSLPLDAAQRDLWAAAFADLNRIRRTPVLDLAKAGLANGGVLALGLDVAGRGVVSRQFTHGGARAWTVKLDKLIKRQSSAFLRLPMERIDGKKESLKIRIELANDVALTEAGVRVLFESSTGKLSIPISEFPSPAAVYATLTNKWGGAKRLQVPAAAFSFEGEPQPAALSNSMKRNVAVLVRDAGGLVVAHANTQVGVVFSADRVATPRCTIILRAASTRQTTMLNLAELGELAPRSVVTLTGHDLLRESLVLRHATPTTMCQLTAIGGCVAANNRAPRRAEDMARKSRLNAL